MKNIFVTLIGIVFLMSCQESDNNGTINGSIKNEEVYVDISDDYTEIITYLRTLEQDGFFSKNNIYNKKICGDIIYYDLGSVTDDPVYYVDTKNEKILGKCGGHLSLSEEITEESNIVSKCPPKEWINCVSKQK